MSLFYGVLLEVVSIQKYVFNSNKLKTNIGGSYLIQNDIFNRFLQEAVETVFGDKFENSWVAWKEKQAELNISLQPFDIGYIGGGNALLFVADRSKAEELIRIWTRILLMKTPGIVTAVALNEFDPDNFRKSLDDLFSLLRVNKGRYVPQTIIPRHGITAECNYSGLSKEVSYKIEDKNDYISSVTAAKIEAAGHNKGSFEELFHDVLGNTYCFPNELSYLGSKSGHDSHIAIVHIDGNSMAKRFRAITTLSEIRQLSCTMHTATLSSLKELITYIVNNYNKTMDYLGFSKDDADHDSKPPMERKKACLPLSPIIVGGDDVTFVCDGRLGIFFAKYFINTFEQKEVSDRKKLTACAGVSITKMKYPFYRGYQLAEELCSNAKTLNSEIDDVEKLCSGLDFQVFKSSVSGNLEKIRSSQYEVIRGNLLFRPYKILTGESHNKNIENSLETMLRLTKELTNRNNYPRNKMKKLIRVLSQSEDMCKKFVTEFEFQHGSLPSMEGRCYEKSLFENKKTIYFDMIELLDFYPWFKSGKDGAA